ncbi:hypothetical protein [Ammoniphilus sp. 3BR4]
MITCDDCGKFQDGNEIGMSWICEDCNHPLLFPSILSEDDPAQS